MNEQIICGIIGLLVALTVGYDIATHLDLETECNNHHGNFYFVSCSSIDHNKTFDRSVCGMHCIVNGTDIFANLSGINGLS